jgi:hypothetical protein
MTRRLILTMAEIVSELKIPRSTVSRLIGSMCDDGIPHRILVNKVGRPVVSKSQYLTTVRDAILATPKPVSYTPRSTRTAQSPPSFSSLARTLPAKSSRTTASTNSRFSMRLASTTVIS